MNSILENIMQELYWSVFLGDIPKKKLERQMGVEGEAVR